MNKEQIAVKKAEERRYFQAVRDAISPTRRDTHSEKIAEKVLALVQERKIRTVFAYLSFGSEPDTHGLIKKLLSLGVQVAVPRCEKSTHTMDAVVIHRMDQLQKGTYGILEPTEGQVLSLGEIEMILLPGLAFAKDGTRLGYGGGYYDRYTENFHGLTVGLAFSACLTEALSKDTFDRPVDLVITEKTETEER